jgi:hypothetical protein
MFRAGILFIKVKPAAGWILPDYKAKDNRSKSMHIIFTKTTVEFTREDLLRR